MEFHHMTPHSKGSPATVDNIQLLCRKCNLAKRDKTRPKPSELTRTSNNNRALRFEVHHIDGDKSNNNDDNLEYLCKRCHMFKHTDAA